MNRPRSDVVWLGGVIWVGLGSTNDNVGLLIGGSVLFILAATVRQRQE